MPSENTSSIATLLLSCSLLALGACGDDGGGTGTSEGASGDTATSTAATTMDSVDTTAGPTQMTTDDPTTGVDTTAGEETGPPPGEVQAFRFTEMFVRDPHFFVLGLGVLCLDVTDMTPMGPSINEQFNAAINGDDPMMPDDNLDLNLLLLFRPLDQGDGATGDMDFANGVCTVPPIECDIQEGTDPFPTTYVSMAAGTCLEPDPTHLSSANYNPQPGSSEGPCFGSAAGDVVINTSAFALPLSDSLIGAQFVGDPANEFVSGTLRGFLSRADAEGLVLPPEIQDSTGAMVIAELLPGGMGNCAAHDDMDGDGWWMYVDFTAQRVPWVGP